MGDLGEVYFNYSIGFANKSFGTLTTMEILIVLALVVVLACGLWLPKWKRRRLEERRAQLMAEPFPSGWREILVTDFALYQRMPADLQAKLESHILVFLHEKTFAGFDGLEINDRVRVLVAAQACVLILNRPTNYFPGFESILIYPDVYRATSTSSHGGVQSHSDDVRAGESWMGGPIVLAWTHVLQGAQDRRDGHNVVMHEFAHKLDEQTAAMNGSPVLSSRAQQDWSKIMSHEFERQQRRSARGQSGVIDDYGATSPAEFFAVVTETFFEKPRQLFKHHPELYEQFQEFYQLNPVEWDARH